MSVGYSKTPTGKKLGYKSGHVARLINCPLDYQALLADWPEEISFTDDEDTSKDIIHLFTKDAKELTKLLPQLKNEIEQNGMIWVSWPKKTSKVSSDVTEDVIRNMALQIGLVDVKVCAVDEIWSGLKLVIPIKNRQ